MNNFLIVLKKELTDILRDRKTLIFTLLLPILMYPILFNIMSTTMNSTKEEVKKEIRIIVEGNKNSSIANLMRKQDGITLEDIEDSSKALKDGKVQLILKVPENFDNSLKEQKESKVEILFDDRSNKSSIALSKVNIVLDSYSKSIVNERLQTINVSSNVINPFSIESKSGISEDGKDNLQMSILMGMIPVLMITFLLTPTIGLSADLGAGEKERGTFEPLLSTSSNRNSVLWGKITSIALILFGSLIASVISLIISIKNFAEKMSSDGGGFELKINGPAIAIIVIFSLLLILVISMLQIGVSIYSRSVKEANTYLSGIIIPQMLLAMIPAYMDANGIKSIFYHIPISNIACIMKEAIFGIYNANHILIVLGWNIVYVGIVIIIIKTLFSKEEVIFRS